MILGLYAHIKSDQFQSLQPGYLQNYHPDLHSQELQEGQKQIRERVIRNCFGHSTNCPTSLVFLLLNHFQSDILLFFSNLSGTLYNPQFLVHQNKTDQNHLVLTPCFFLFFFFNFILFLNFT